MSGARPGRKRSMPMKSMKPPRGELHLRSCLENGRAQLGGILHQHARSAEEGVGPGAGRGGRGRGIVPGDGFPRGTWILAAAILGSSMVFIDGTVVNVALPALQSSLHTTTAGIQWVVEAYTLFLASLLLLGGSLGDLSGRRRILGAGVVLFAGTSVWCGLAPDITHL